MEWLIQAVIAGQKDYHYARPCVQGCIASIMVEGVAGLTKARYSIIVKFFGFNIVVSDAIDIAWTA